MSSHSSEKAPSRKEAFKSIRKTRVPQGVSNIYYSLILMLLSIIGGLLGASVIAANRQMASLWLLIVGLSLIVASIISIVGTFQCLSAPDQMAGRGAITASVFLYVLCFPIAVIGVFTKLPPLIDVIQNLLSLIAFVNFLSFLKHLAYYIHDNDMCNRAERLQTFGVIIVVLFISSITVAVLVPPLEALGMFIFGLMALIGFFRYVRLLHDMKAALNRS